MASKDYTKGMAQLAWRVERYISKYNLDSPNSVKTSWPSQLQQAAVTMRAAAATIDSAVAFREQP